MIVEPLNDRACLDQITELARSRVGTAEIGQLAERFSTTDQLAAWLRTLPHRTDDGNPVDGPKVACDVLQRIRIPTLDPNCAERAAIYIAVAERIDPAAVYQLATIDTSNGRHTYPVEDGTAVLLDPAIPRNALLAGVDLIAQASGRGRTLTLSEALGWALDIASEPAADYEDGFDVLDVAAEVAAAVLDGAPIDGDGLAALLWVLALAEREEARWWPGRAGAIRLVVEVLAERAPRLVVDAYADDQPRDAWRLRWAPRRWARAVERAAQPAAEVARPLVKPALMATLAAYGVPPELVVLADRGREALDRSDRARVAVDSARADQSSAGRSSAGRSERIEEP